MGRLGACYSFVAFGNNPSMLLSRTKPMLLDESRGDGRFLVVGTLDEDGVVRRMIVGFGVTSSLAEW